MFNKEFSPLQTHPVINPPAVQI